MDSPQARRSPHHFQMPRIEPLRFNVPAPLPAPAIAAAVAAVHNDPFGVHNPIPLANPAPQVMTVNYQGQELRLTPGMAANLAALPAFPAPPARAPRHVQRNDPPPMPVSIFIFFLPSLNL